MRSDSLKYLFILIIHLSFASFGFAQESVGLSILEKVNNLRDSLNLNPLEIDTVLIEAGKDQAYYMAVNKELSHFQKTFTKETPSERVAYYKGNRTYVGENVAVVPSKDKKERVLNPEQIANSLYLGWLNSPPHYKNMVNPYYTKMGVGFSVSKSGKIYASQVFSSNEIQLPEAFHNSELAWGVRPAEFTCKDEPQTYETMFFANNIIVEGNTIYFYFHDRQFFENVIQNDNDGLAVDIILREQIPCGKENQFHISAVHDGEMQRPVYKNDIYRFNEANNPRKIKVKLGVVPEYLRDKIWEPNIIVIKDNKLCDYSFPIEVPSAIYPLLDLQPYYEMDDSINTRMGGADVAVSIKDSMHVELEYLRSEKEFYSISVLQFQEMLEWIGYIKKINVECYASVEGASWFNQELLEERLNAVSELLEANSFDMNKVQIEASENWPLMDAQIEEKGIDVLKGKTQSEIKRYFRNHKSAFIDSLLFKQRSTHIHAYIDTTLQISSYEDMLFSSKYDSTLTADMLEWNKILREEYILPGKTIEVGLIDSLKLRNELKTNLLGASSIGNTVSFMDSLLVQKFIEKVDTANAKQVFNYAHFLTKYWFARYSTSYETTGTAISISPEDLRKMIAKLDTVEIRPNDIIRLKVNILLSGIHYYVAHNAWNKTNSYFESISELVHQGNFSMEEAMELALFCNYFYKFETAVEILQPFYDKGLLSEDGYFLMAKTASLIRDVIEPKDYHKYMESAKRANHSRYCNWLDTSFQIQRDEFIKNDFCKECR